MAMDVLLVDDEPLARERLKRLLAEHSDVHLAGEAAHGEAALDWLRLNRVQLVLLDIQMPGKTGLEVAAAIQELPKPPHVIFCTAYDEHALSAFRVKALDYLLKPVRPEDLAAALQRAREWISKTEPASATVPAPARQHLSAQTYRGLEVIALDKVIACIAEQKYVTVLHQDGETLIDDSLKKLEEQFPDFFVRAHRNALVTKHKIARLETLANGGHQVHLHNLSQPISVSRRQLAELKQRMKQL